MVSTTRKASTMQFETDSPKRLCINPVIQNRLNLIEICYQQTKELFEQNEKDPSKYPKFSICPKFGVNLDLPEEEQAVEVLEGFKYHAMSVFIRNKGNASLKKAEAACVLFSDLKNFIKHPSCVNVSRFYLKTFPFKLFNIPFIKKGTRFLNFSFNPDLQINGNIFELENLRALNLAGNRLIEISPEIAHLCHLKALNLSFNALQNLPPLENLQLHLFNIEGNPLDQVTEQTVTTIYLKMDLSQQSILNTVRFEGLKKVYVKVPENTKPQFSRNFLFLKDSVIYMKETTQKEEIIAALKELKKECEKEPLPRCVFFRYENGKRIEEEIHLKEKDLNTLSTSSLASTSTEVSTETEAVISRDVSTDTTDLPGDRLLALLDSAITPYDGKASDQFALESVVDSIINTTLQQDAVRKIRDIKNSIVKEMIDDEYVEALLTIFLATTPRQPVGQIPLSEEEKLEEWFNTFQIEGLFAKK